MFAKWLRSLFVLTPASGSRKPAVVSPSVTAAAVEPPKERSPVALEEQRLRWRCLVRELLTGRVPDGLEYPESLSLAKLRLRSLPANLTVRGDLDLRQCQRLRRIGNALTVDGDLQIGGRCDDRLWYEDATCPHPLCSDSQPPLESLPELLKVGGQLTLRSCHRLKRLPQKFEMGGLHIEGCHGFESLPESISSYERSLTLKGCPQLRRLPDSLHVQGNLRLIGLPLTALPSMLKVDGHLILECCPQLSSLPNQLQVGKNLTIRKCPIAVLPDDLRVGGNLVIKRCPALTALPFIMAVGGNVYLSKCPELTTVQTVTRFSKSLRINDCPKLSSLPTNLTVPGTLDLARCAGLTALPSGTEIGLKSQYSWRPSLVIADCHQLQSLPNDLKITGPIDLAGSGLKALPESLSKVRVMWRGMAIRAEAVLAPERLSATEILEERNAEVRRVMLERVGCDQVLEKAKARTIDQDHDAGGPRRLVQIASAHYLQCRCPSTGRVYLLRVPPTTRTCRVAAAWLAGFDNPNDYRPLVET